MTPELLKDIPRRIQQSRYNSFSMSGWGLESKDLEQIVVILNQYPKITDLDLSVNNLDYDAVPYLLDLKYVNTINLERNNVNNKGALLLAKKFQRIYLIQNSLNEKGIKQIIECEDARFLMLVVEDEFRESGAMRWLSKETRQQLKDKIKENNIQHDSNETTNCHKKCSIM